MDRRETCCGRDCGDATAGGEDVSGLSLVPMSDAIAPSMAFCCSDWRRVSGSTSSRVVGRIVPAWGLPGTADGLATSSKEKDDVGSTGDVCARVI